MTSHRHISNHSNDIVSTKIYYICNDFDFEIINSPILDGDVPHSTSYGDYISQLEHLAMLLISTLTINFKLINFLNKAISIINFAKLFYNSYLGYHNLKSKFNIVLKSLLRQGLSEPEFYGDLVYTFKKIVSSNILSRQFIATYWMLGGQPNHGWQL